MKLSFSFFCLNVFELTATLRSLSLILQDFLKSKARKLITEATVRLRHQ